VTLPFLIYKCLLALFHSNIGSGILYGVRSVMADVLMLSWPIAEAYAGSERTGIVFQFTDSDIDFTDVITDSGISAGVKVSIRESIFL